MDVDEQILLLAAVLPPPWRYFAKRPGAVRGGVSRSAPDLALALRDLRAFDVYLQANPSHWNGVKAAREDIFAIRSFFLDLDPVTPDAAPLKAASLVALVAYHPHPVILDTGRGAQVWFRFDPVPVDRWDFTLPGFLNAVSRSFSWPLHDCILDRSVANVTHLCRMPGSINQRTGRMVRITRQGTPIPQHRVQQILHTFYEPPVPPAIRPGIASVGQALPFLPLTAATFLTEGVDEGDRHRAACSTVYSLREYAIREEAISAAVHRGAQLCSPPLPAREVERILSTTKRASRRAYARVQRR